MRPDYRDKSYTSLGELIAARNPEMSREDILEKVKEIHDRVKKLRESVKATSLPVPDDFEEILWGAARDFMKEMGL